MSLLSCTSSAHRLLKRCVELSSSEPERKRGKECEACRLAVCKDNSKLGALTAHAEMHSKTVLCGLGQRIL